MNTHALYEYAYEKLLFSLKYDHFDDYVLGFPIFGVHVGNKHCVFAKMHAIYEYHQKNPSDQIDEKFFNILLDHTQKVKGSEAFVILTETIEYQIVAEKENRAPFCIDCGKLLSCLSKNLYQNQELYRSERYEQIHFWKTMEAHHESLLNFGYSLL